LDSQQERLSLFIAFAQVAFSYMKGWLEDTEIKPYVIKKRTFEEDGWGDTFVTDVEWTLTLILQRHKDTIWQFSEGLVYARQCINDRVWQKNVRIELSAQDISSPEIQSQLTNELIRPLVNVVLAYGTIKPSIAQITEVFELYDKTWHSPFFTRSVTILLQNFRSLLEPIQLGKYKLSSFTLEEKNAFYMLHNKHSLGWSYGLSDLEFPDIRNTLTAAYNRDKDAAASYNDGEFASECELILTTLRLLKVGMVGAGMIFFTDVAQSSIHPLELHTVKRRGNSVYELTEVDIPILYELVNDFNKHVQNQLAVAIRRFNLAYTRSFPEDRIIDLTIALESCLLNDVEDELKYRLALRGAALLNKTHIPSETQKLLRIIYDVRSAIVHSGKSLTDTNIEKMIKKIDPSLVVSNFPQVCENIVRDILRKLIKELHSGESLKNFSLELDNQIVNSLKP